MLSLKAKKNCSAEVGTFVIDGANLQRLTGLST